MQSKKDKNHPIPATIILNPDLFGEWQKGKSSKNFQKEYGDSGSFKHIDVKKALKEALRSENIEKSAILSAVDSDISNNVLGWVKSQSLLIKHIAPDVVFGWVINLWNPGTSLWSHADTQTTLKAANSVVSFLKFIKVYHAGDYKPDFIVFDKYERDGFSAAGKPYYAFGSREWKNYLTFVKKITDNINSPAMLWQIPGGHMPVEGEEGLCETGVTSNCFNYMQHSASGGTYFMGDDRIGSSVENIMQEVLNIPLSPSIYGGASTVKALLMQDPNYDWSQSQIELAKSANVFAILWGGGETTGVSPISTNQTGGFKWLAQKVSSYEQHPQKLDGKSTWNIHVDLPPKNTNTDHNNSAGDKK